MSGLHAHFLRRAPLVSPSQCYTHQAVLKKLRELFAPNTFITLERAVRASNATPEILKSSRLQTVYFIFFMAYILFAVIAVIESGA